VIVADIAIARPVHVGPADEIPVEPGLLASALAGEVVGDTLGHFDDVGDMRPAPVEQLAVRVPGAIVRGVQCRCRAAALQDDVTQCRVARPVVRRVHHRNGGGEEVSRADRQEHGGAADRWLSPDEVTRLWRGFNPQRAEPILRRTPGFKSFLVLFFKKEPLSYRPSARFLGR
jgi:hypothetical protein